MLRSWAFWSVVGIHAYGLMSIAIKMATARLGWKLATAVGIGTEALLVDGLAIWVLKIGRKSEVPFNSAELVLASPNRPDCINKDIRRGGEPMGVQVNEEFVRELIAQAIAYGRDLTRLEDFIREVVQRHGLAMEVPNLWNLRKANRGREQE